MQQPVGLGLAVFAGEPFDGLLAEVRFRVASSRGRVFRRPKGWRRWCSSASCAAGGSSSRRRGGPAPPGGKTSWCGPAAGGRTRRSGSPRSTGSASPAIVPSRWRRRCSSPATRTGSAGSSSGSSASAGPAAAAGAAAAVGGLAALLGLVGYGCVEKAGEGRWSWVVVLVVWGAVVGFVFSIFVRAEAGLLFGLYRELRGLYARLYEGSVRLAVLGPAEAGASPELANPSARKYTADLVAAGFGHAGDTRLVGDGVGGVFRVFYAPDGSAYLTVLFQAATRPRPGGCVRDVAGEGDGGGVHVLPGRGAGSSMSGGLLGYRRKRTGPEVGAGVPGRARPGGTGPASRGRGGGVHGRDPPVGGAVRAVRGVRPPVRGAQRRGPPPLRRRPVHLGRPPALATAGAAAGVPGLMIRSSRFQVPGSELKGHRLGFQPGPWSAPAWRGNRACGPGGRRGYGTSV